MWAPGHALVSCSYPPDSRAYFLEVRHPVTLYSPQVFTGQHRSSSRARLNSTLSSAAESSVSARCCESRKPLTTPEINVWRQVLLLQMDSVRYVPRRLSLVASADRQLHRFLYRNVRESSLFQMTENLPLGLRRLVALNVSGPVNCQVLYTVRAKSIARAATCLTLN